MRALLVLSILALTGLAAPTAVAPDSCHLEPITGSCTVQLCRYLAVLCMCGDLVIPDWVICND